MAPKLTPKGQATRARIIEAAADLIYERGVHGTNNELVRRRAEVSGSQLGHYFPDKESLVRAVIEERAEQVVRLHEELSLDSLAALRAWAGFYVGRQETSGGGCSFGSLAAEIIKTDLAVRDDLAAGFERWKDPFRRGLRGMRERGEFRKDADPDHLATVIMAALQGGMLLAQAARDTTPLRDALDGALAYTASFASTP